MEPRLVYLLKEKDALPSGKEARERNSRATKYIRFCGLCEYTSLVAWPSPYFYKDFDSGSYFSENGRP